MTGLDHTFDYDKGILHVHFRPDKTPEDKAEWFRILGNYCHTYSKLLNKGMDTNTDTSTNDDMNNDKDMGIYKVTLIVHDIDTTLDIIKQMNSREDVEFTTATRKL